jgi:hypothetical protein
VRQANPGESDHDYMRDARLPNWGRDGRRNPDKPDNERGASSIYSRGRADKQGEQTAADGTVIDANEDAPDPINVADADYLDGYIRQLSALHKVIICAKFYKLQQVNRMDTDAAVRALLDLIGANRQVVDKMRRMRWG